LIIDPKQIAKQIMEFNKSIFENTFDAMTALQNQTEKFVLDFMEKVPWITPEGKKTINDWAHAYKKGRSDYKLFADEHYNKIADYFIKKEEAASPKAMSKKRKK
jgi:hypothetical protein